MKKRILIVIILLLFTTGCTCEYNLTIENNTFKEEVKLNGNNSNEISNFSLDWQIPTDKDEYNAGLDQESNPKFDSSLYKYNLNGNTLTFNYDFGIADYPNSAAVSNCYNTLNVINRQNNIIISTSKENMCFDSYPNLTSLKISIKVDRTVNSHNADSVNGNIYTWNITKNNASNKPINLVLTNDVNNNVSNNDNRQNSNNTTRNDYSLYIFCGILLIAMLSVYFISKKLKNNNSGVDD